MLEAFAALAIAQQEYQRAARLLGASEALRSEAGISTEPSDHPALHQVLASAADPLSTTEARAARRAGRAMSLSEAADYALQRTDG